MVSKVKWIYYLAYLKNYVQYKPKKQNKAANGLFHQPDYDKLIYKHVHIIDTRGLTLYTVCAFVREYFENPNLLVIIPEKEVFKKGIQNLRIHQIGLLWISYWKNCTSVCN